MQAERLIHSVLLWLVGCGIQHHYGRGDKKIFDVTIVLLYISYGPPDSLIYIWHVS